MVPGATAADIRSQSSLLLSSGPSSRAPMRSESGDTRNVSLVKASCGESSKRSQSEPGTTRSLGSCCAGLDQSCDILQAAIFSWLNLSIRVFAHAELLPREI